MEYRRLPMMDNVSNFRAGSLGLDTTPTRMGLPGPSVVTVLCCASVTTRVRVGIKARPPPLECDHHPSPSPKARSRVKYLASNRVVSLCRLGGIPHSPCWAAAISPSHHRFLSPHMSSHSLPRLHGVIILTMPPITLIPSANDDKNAVNMCLRRLKSSSFLVGRLSRS